MTDVCINLVDETNDHPVVFFAALYGQLITAGADPAEIGLDVIAGFAQELHRQHHALCELFTIVAPPHAFHAAELDHFFLSPATTGDPP